MAKRKVKSTGITFALNDPGMGEYERVGLAGFVHEPYGSGGVGKG